MDITLALGGGGSRGNAHIGVLRVLENAGYTIRAVAGTSAGGIAAALYAAGYSPDEMEKIYAEVDQTKALWRMSGDGPSLLGLSGAAKVLGEILGERTFQDLKIPCAMVAVDIKSSREIVLDDGNVLDAVLATIAIPAIFPPQQRGAYQLVDGGVLNPVPVSVARSMLPSLPVVAVVLSNLVERPENPFQIPLPANIPDLVVKTLTRTRLAQTFNIFIQSMDTSSRMLTELRLEIDAPEIIIRPQVGHIGLLEKVDVHEIVLLGEKAAKAVLPDLKRTGSWSRRVQRQWFPQRTGRKIR